MFTTGQEAQSTASKIITTEASSGKGNHVKIQVVRNRHVIPVNRPEKVHHHPSIMYTHCEKTAKQDKLHAITV
jgi:hypothetical protein